MNVHPPDALDVPLRDLDELWFQVTGTRCNLACRHCFIACSPQNDRFGFLSLDQVRAALRESVSLRVKEYYFTGGEPMLHPQIVPMLVETLRLGPATVLTNGTVLRDAWLETLRRAEEASPYSLEWRVSIDGVSPQTNDPIRGEGTFHRAMQGVARLVAHGFLPIVTAARTWPEEEEPRVLAELGQRLREAGCPRPRIKVLPLLRLGAEAQRGRAYFPSERITPAMMAGFDRRTLLCDHARVITDRGVYVCPILLEEPAARLGPSLGEAADRFRVAHGACYTCYLYGTICSNPSSAAPATVQSPHHATQQGRAGEGSPP